MDREREILTDIKLPVPDEAYSMVFRCYHKQSAEEMYLTEKDKSKAFEGALFSISAQIFLLAVIYLGFSTTNPVCVPENS